MGLFADIKAIKDIQKIKDGKSTRNLSISQITGLITNMTDARKNLTSEEFDNVYELFNRLRKCNTKIKMNLEGYLETCMEIIKKFDVIAPYEKYSGGNELEISFLMNTIKTDNKEEKVDFDDDFSFTEDDMQYINQMVSSSMGMISEEDAKKVIKVIYAFATFGKKYAVQKFEVFATTMTEKDKFMAIPRIAFMSGVLKANNIIDEKEMNEINNKYEALALDLLKK